ncbi:cuticle protein AM1159-like isoform X1 [Portunus trituberculatus]|uniref:cuticle protein AM1159-like isoform X1 n=1 Tax=Portunus trituberculatus TaxID=210409 RepID=UPI001E1D0B26|nr:cuticle protein AM1159-like isoform X1 [Portunus trituberculatus]XP_045101415.1 cuticle protein AM1159-like isoform X1 [Portunus trituberculatus]
MSEVALASVLAVVAASQDKDATIVVDERTDSGDGNFSYNVKTSNGIEISRTGTPGSEGQSNFRGSFRFPLNDGTFLEVTYVADELGYKPRFAIVPEFISPLSVTSARPIHRSSLAFSPDARSSLPF